jgi:hypothetical protein
VLQGFEADIRSMRAVDQSFEASAGTPPVPPEGGGGIRFPEVNPPNAIVPPELGAPPEFRVPPVLTVPPAPPGGGGIRLPEVKPPGLEPA